MVEISCHCRFLERGGIVSVFCNRSSVPAEGFMAVVKSADLNLMPLKPK